MTTDTARPVPTGLTTAEVAERVAAGKVNEAPDPRSRSLGSIFRENTLTSFNLVIGSLWILMIVAQAPIQDSLFGIVIIVNSAIGIIQEWRAKRTLEKLSLVGEAKPVVRRDGESVAIRPSEIVLDDVIELGVGDQIVVDGTMLSAIGLEADESLLTGEADPVAKHAGDEVMSGSFVVAGSGLMRATAVGEDAYATQLASEARKFTVTRSELMSSIMRFVRIMTYVLIPLGTLLFISQMIASPDWQEALSGTVAGVVTMVPEGLVLLTSVAMAVAVVRLGAKGTLVQEMPAVEVLARVDVVCVDKTGTLTEPGMAVRQTVTLDDTAPIDAVLGAMGASEANPNPTLAAVAAHHPDPGWRMVDSVPFSSARKWSAAQFADHGCWVMGAPEILLTAAPAAAPGVAAEAERLAAGGARVLLLAQAESLPGADESLPVLRPVALVSIDQRLRPDAAETVAYFLDQGVQVKVISGDNPVTVGAIAAQAGIPLADDPFDARELPTDTDAMAEVLESHGVFGRVTPAQKRAMVSALQSRGHTVAMTGDGVNDVLALKDSDLGIAMGSGAAATRAVAQIVLLTNSFAVMPSVVAEGRRVLGNIERVSSLFLTKSFYSAVLSFLVVFFTLTNIFRVEFVFLPRHLTVITWLTIGIPATLLALLPNSQRFRPGFFNRVLLFAVPAGLICGIASFTSYFLALKRGLALEEARTSAAITLFIISMTVLAMVARPLIGIRLVLVIAMGVGFLGFLYIPWLSEFFALRIDDDAKTSIAVILGALGAVAFVLINRMTTRRLAATETSVPRVEATDHREARR
ncbi:MAG: HAD-IC family P-type ATPase [Actinobacteria bacterium]|nr:HAD-IC family P-type ATPase [Actinomycetota bacterium]MCB9411333.1 HAD-IC family P-type ATPase [Actinomycetota bacterium]